MFFRGPLNVETACATYLVGSATQSQFAVVDPHIDLVDDYIALAQAPGSPIVQADRVFGPPELAARTRARPCLPSVLRQRFARGEIELEDHVRRLEALHKHERPAGRQ